MLDRQICAISTIGSVTAEIEAVLDMVGRSGLAIPLFTICQRYV
jgi:hypothetical protein